MVTFRSKGNRLGRLSTPRRAHCPARRRRSMRATTGRITITGSNGSSSSSIGPFTIAVKAPVLPTTGSATLSWTEPTENTDGTPITGLAGYHIYYGTSQGSLTSTITVASATETSYVITGLAPGTYYFTVVAFNYGRHRQPCNRTWPARRFERFGRAAGAAALLKSIAANMMRSVQVVPAANGAMQTLW